MGSHLEMAASPLNDSRIMVFPGLFPGDSFPGSVPGPGPVL